ncbi:hypothetical protein [Pantoea stewartii]|uniref:hypothetical protein n=1 Tax=Pantoea stewartii TaxID=66269 RepID=UPI0012444EFF|nr:hypothetical protein [Pantoea stewartii]KAB0554568.1 hypothetical protein F7Q90_11695 [Pantoea stewartii subsp. stewartii]
MISHAPEPKMVASGRIRHRHYLITVHALERYIERIGGDAGDMIAEIDSSWLFDFNQRGHSRRCCASAAAADRAGGYTLSSGRAMFIVFPKEQHAIVTTLSTGAIG